MSEVLTGDSVWPAGTYEVFDRAARRIAERSPRELAAWVEEQVHEHDTWRLSVVNLLGADGIMSHTARRLLDSDMATRAFEGLPGDRDTSTTPAQASQWCDEIEATIVALAQRLFRARFVEWRGVSTSMSNAITLKALCDVGDTVVVQSMSAGANMSYQQGGVVGVLGMRAVDLPGTELFGIDLDSAARVIRETRPRAIVLGGTKVLFRYPLAELRELADEVGAKIIFDAAHVGPFIHAGIFNDPLAEGVDVLVMGTHKIMGGPVGGLILTNDEQIAAAVERSVWPSFLQTRDQNKYAAAAVSLAELSEHGVAYANAVAANAKALAAALDERGFEVLGADRGYTETHQVIMRLGDGPAEQFATACSQSEIMLAHTNIFGELRSDIAASGVRASVSQVTRMGMREPEMARIADLMTRVREGDEAVADDARALAAAHTRVHYSFD